jgi:transposase-like protein
MSKKGQRDSGREQFWREVIAAWPKSRKSISAFCLERGLSEASFYHWRRTLRQRDLAPVAASSPTLVPVRVLAGTMLEIVLPTGLMVRVPVGTEASVVAGLVVALRAASC